MAELADIFKALADPTRLAIFELVRTCSDSGCSEQDAADSLSKIAARFDLSLSTVSHHVKELRRAGLIRCQKRGQTLYCRPDPDVMNELDRFVQGNHADRSPA
jgi:DNA-binding transcriptional ArsR family regulator